MHSNSKKIVITGASTGIGYELARLFTDHGYFVYGSVRREEDAERLSASFGENFRSLLFDVTDHDAVQKAAWQVTQDLGEQGLDGLINNAGIAIGGPFIDLSTEDFLAQFQVNVFGLVAVTKAFLPLLGARESNAQNPGKILMISSVAGKQGMPFMSPYSGSKFAIEGITECLRKELMLFGVDVVLIEPGPIKTPIWDKGISDLLETRFKDSPYQEVLANYENKFLKPAIKKALTAENAAQKILRVFEKKKPKARYVMLKNKFTNWTLPQLLPSRMVDKVIGKLLGLSK
ncbi:MAG: SDR family oxidoreductase [Bacteroidota bacterium]